MWWRTSNCNPLLIYRPREDERLSWPGWLTYSGRLTHISGHPSARSSAGRRKNAGQRLTFYRWATQLILKYIFQLAGRYCCSTSCGGSLAILSFWPINSVTLLKEASPNHVTRSRNLLLIISLADRLMTCGMIYGMKGKRNKSYRLIGGNDSCRSIQVR